MSPLDLSPASLFLPPLLLLLSLVECFGVLKAKILLYKISRTLTWNIWDCGKWPIWLFSWRTCCWKVLPWPAERPGGITEGNRISVGDCMFRVFTPRSQDVKGCISPNCLLTEVSGRGDSCSAVCTMQCCDQCYLSSTNLHTRSISKHRVCTLKMPLVSFLQIGHTDYKLYILIMVLTNINVCMHTCFIQCSHVQQELFYLQKKILCIHYYMYRCFEKKVYTCSRLLVVSLT